MLVYSIQMKIFPAIPLFSSVKSQVEPAKNEGNRNGNENRKNSIEVVWWKKNLNFQSILDEVWFFNCLIYEWCRFRSGYRFLFYRYQLIIRQPDIVLIQSGIFFTPILLLLLNKCIDYFSSVSRPFFVKYSKKNFHWSYKVQTSSFQWHWQWWKIMIYRLDHCSINHHQHLSHLARWTQFQTSTTTQPQTHTHTPIQQKWPPFYIINNELFC